MSISMIQDGPISAFKPKQNWRNFTDIFIFIFLNQNYQILIKISVKFLPCGLNGNKSTMIHVMNRHQVISWTNVDPYLQCLIWCHQATINFLNTLRLRQNGCHFADNIFKCIFLNESVRISNEISLKFVPKGLISNIPALIQIMASCWLGNKPLSEPTMVRLLTHICITQLQ